MATHPTPQSDTDHDDGLLSIDAYDLYMHTLKS